MRPTGGVGGFSGSAAGVAPDEREEQELLLERTSIARQVFLLCTAGDPEKRPSQLATAIEAFTCFSKKVDLSALSQSDLVQLRTAQEQALAALRAGQGELDRLIRLSSVGLTTTNAVLAQKIEATERGRFTMNVGAYEASQLEQKANEVVMTYPDPAAPPQAWAKPPVPAAPNARKTAIYPEPPDTLGAMLALMAPKETK